MARTKAVLGEGARLTDFLSASLMARVVPPEVINEVLDAHGRNSQRIRAFPAVAGVYYVMALSLYPKPPTRRCSRRCRRAWPGMPARRSRPRWARRRSARCASASARSRWPSWYGGAARRWPMQPFTGRRSTVAFGWSASTAAPSSFPTSSTTTRRSAVLAVARARRATRRRAARCWPSAPRTPSWRPTWVRTAAASGSCACRCSRA